MVNHISVKGYKSFRDLQLSLGNLNLLIGSNGSGKSNFLSLFELLNNAFEQRIASYVATLGGVDKLLFQGRKTTEQIEIRLRMDRNSYLLNLQESDGKMMVANEGLGYYLPSGWGDMVSIAQFVPEAQIKIYDGLKRGDFIKTYLSHIRKFHFHDTGRRSPFASECHIKNDAYYLYAHGENLAPILLRIRQEQPMVYRRIVRVIQSIAPYFGDFFFNVSPAETIRLQWQDKYSDMVYGPNDLSDGTIRFIALATLFMQPDLPSVIIIDEPELGLHPVAIRKLAGLIKSASRRSTQIIIATQSAELISQFEPDNIITVTQKDGVSQMVRLDKEALKQWMGEYTLGDLWTQSIMEGGQPV